ncbi:MAG: protein-export rane protein SecD [Marmoricola sp.]|nr:protein-export rane protein SecD [Marmoricola sp.]
MAKKTSRPGRTLLIFFISVAVLYGLAALGGTFKPKLGLDLEGGTRITLQADSDSGISQTKLKQAKTIIENRVNGSGVVEAEVTIQGSKNIVVEIPGKNAGKLVDQVKRTAQLRFRIVGAIASPQPAVTATPTPTTGATPSKGATPSSGASPSSKATAKVSPSTSPTASPTTSAAKPRPAPLLADAADPTGTATPKVSSTPKASTTKSPSPTAAATPAAGTNAAGATAVPPTGKDAASKRSSNAIAWAKSPDEASLAAFAAYTCPEPGSAATPPNDDPDKILVTCDDTGTKYLLSYAVVEGTSLKDASAGIPQGELNWAVSLTLKGKAVNEFGDISRALYNSDGQFTLYPSSGGQFAIVLDAKVISNAGFSGIITNGSAQISGTFSETEARSLANSLKFGALPIKFKSDPTVETIGATLAGDQLSAGIVAGIIGLIIVMIYCLLYYRGLGLVVVASLLVAGAVTYAMVLVLAKSAGFALTLPGIAGLIVAVGITADSFIVYFERIRDEMRLGKSMRVAVESGWIRARNTCLAADAVSLLAAVVLYIFAIGVVRGFAFALGISTLIDVAVFFWFTKPTVSLLAKKPYFNNGGRWSGLSPETLGIDGEPNAPRIAGGTA